MSGQVIKTIIENYTCEKSKSNVTIQVETVGVFGGDSVLPIHTFDRKKCLDFYKVAACHVCDYRP